MHENPSTTEALATGFEFDGWRINCVMYKGQRCFPAAEVGRAIGYAHDGARLRTAIRDDWSEDFIEGEHCFLVEGEDLTQLRLDNPDLVLSKTRRLVLLTEPGLHMALLRTRKPKGRELRRKLAAEVLPQVARVGEFSPSREVVDNIVVERATLEPVTTSLDERRMAVAEGRLDLDLRQAQAAAIDQLTQDLHAVLDAPSLQALRVRRASVMLNDPLRHLAPMLPAGPVKIQATEIGRRLGISRQLVGRLLTRTKCRKDPSLFETRLTVAENSDKQVPIYLWDPKVVTILRDYMRSQS